MGLASATWPTNGCMFLPVSRICGTCTMSRRQTSAEVDNSTVGASSSLGCLDSPWHCHRFANLIIRKLASYPCQNSLHAALREVGRIERTLFMLEWMQDPELRKRVQVGLNKGEARNAPARAVFFNRQGELSKTNVTASAASTWWSLLSYCGTRSISSVLSRSI